MPLTLTHHLVLNDRERRYLIVEAMPFDLGYMMKWQEEPLELEHVQVLSFQIMAGLSFLHSAGVLHRDLVSVFSTFQLECATQFKMIL